ncbi:ABC transporter ATP-binding protein [Swaminathania salitolerans]|nr:ABC transporter ATP-binding protein [Swaminathania salitolerans]
MRDAVSILNLTKILDGRPILNDVSFALRTGTITALLGPNGAGKTTLLGCLLGLLAPDAGDMTLLGEPTERLSPATRSRIGFVPQSLTGLGWFHVQELLTYVASYRDRPEDREDPVWMQWAALAPQARIRSLSGGERQRLAIVLAMRFSPDLIFLDEPIASLDPQARYDFMRLLPGYVRRRNATVLISSHILSDLEAFCDRYLILDRGTLLMDVEAEALGTRYRRLPAHAAAASGGREVIAAADGSVWIDGHAGDTEAEPSLPASIEHLFLALTR